MLPTVLFCGAGSANVKVVPDNAARLSHTLAWVADGKLQRSTSGVLLQVLRDCE